MSLSGPEIEPREDVPEPEYLRKIRAAAVIPVITCLSVEQALSAARTIQRGGLSMVEITFRSDIAADAIAAIRSAIPDMEVGAGTLLTIEAVEAAKGAGALFGASPAFDLEVVHAASERHFPFLPGVATPSEICAALRAGSNLLKYFPAEPAGGTKTLTTVVQPFAHLNPSFVAMGGITPELTPTYLTIPQVVAVGVSWVCPEFSMRNSQWGLIRRFADNAAQIVARARSNGKREWRGETRFE